MTLSEKWADGAATLHGFLTRGLPNCLFASGVQSGQSANFAHIIDEQSKHIAYLIDQARRRDARTIEPTADAEQAWAQEVIASARGRQAYQAECTPGYYNNEGQFDPVAATNGAYWRGPTAFIRLLDAWRRRRPTARTRTGGRIRHPGTGHAEGSPNSRRRLVADGRTQPVTVEHLTVGRPPRLRAERIEHRPGLCEPVEPTVQDLRCCGAEERQRHTFEPQRNVSRPCIGPEQRYRPTIEHAMGDRVHGPVGAGERRVGEEPHLATEHRGVELQGSASIARETSDTGSEPSFPDSIQPVDCRSVHHKIGPTPILQGRSS